MDKTIYTLDEFSNAFHIAKAARNAGRVPFALIRNICSKPCIITADKYKICIAPLMLRDESTPAESAVVGEYEIGGTVEEFGFEYLSLTQIKLGEDWKIGAKKIERYLSLIETTLKQKPLFHCTGICVEYTLKAARFGRRELVNPRTVGDLDEIYQTSFEVWETADAASIFKSVEVGDDGLTILANGVRGSRDAAVKALKEGGK